MSKLSINLSPAANPYTTTRANPYTPANAASDTAASVSAPTPSVQPLGAPAAPATQTAPAATPAAAAVQQQPPAVPVPRLSPDEQVRALSHVAAGVSAAKEDKVATAALRDLRESEFEFALSFFSKIAACSPDLGALEACVAELASGSPGAADIVERFLKAAAITEKLPSAATYRPNNKVIPTNELWRRREKRKARRQDDPARNTPPAGDTQVVKSAAPGKWSTLFSLFTRRPPAGPPPAVPPAGGKINHLLPQVMGLTAAGTTPLVFDKDTPTNELVENAIWNYFGGLTAGYGAQVGREAQQALRPLLAEKARIAPGGVPPTGPADFARYRQLEDMIRSEKMLRLKGMAGAGSGATAVLGSNLLMNPWLAEKREKKKQIAAEAETAGKQLELQQQQLGALQAQEASAAREREARERTAKTEADVAAKQLQREQAQAERESATAAANKWQKPFDTAWKTGVGLGTAALGAYGIYSILKSIRERRERETRTGIPKGNIRLTLPGQGGREVLVEVPRSELPEYMQRQLSTDLRRNIRAGLDARRGRRLLPEPAAQEG